MAHYPDMNLVYDERYLERWIAYGQVEGVLTDQIMDALRRLAQNRRN